MSTLLARGKPYYVTFTATLTPVENGTLSFNIGPKYSFAAGNSVIVSGQFTSAIRCEGIVQSYNSSSGAIVLESITNIIGSFSTTLFQITLAGERGSRITAAPGVPSDSVGRVGDLRIDSTTGEVYIKSL